MLASGLTEFIPFICTSAIWANLVSLFTFLLAFPQLLSSHCGVAAATGSQYWEPLFTSGAQESLMAVTFLIY